MNVCTFFGHGDADEEIKEKLERAIVSLIISNGVNMFYVGTHGNFDKYSCGIECRNKRMEEKSTYVLTYVHRSFV